MKAKGMVVNLRTMLIMMKPILISVLYKTSEMEKCLIGKGYR